MFQLSDALERSAVELAREKSAREQVHSSYEDKISEVQDLLEVMDLVFLFYFSRGIRAFGFYVAFVF